MKILIVDDNKDITDLFHKFLTLKKYLVEYVNDGKNGLSLMQDNNYDVLILDLAMPNFTGFDVLEELQKKNKTKSNNIIVLSAVPLTDTDEEMLKKYGVKEILRKPMELDALIEIIETYSKK